MDYLSHYKSLIRKSKSKKRVRLKRTDINWIYYEKHHIIPKSCGGSNKKSNLVLLTAREHFIAHRLLAKLTKQIYGENHNYTIKMVYSLNSFINRKASTNADYKINSRTYEYLKNLCSLNSSTEAKLFGMWKGNKNPSYINHPRGMLGKKHSNKTKKLLSLKTSGKNNGMYGKTHTKEVKEKQSIRASLMIGELNGFFGKLHTKETKDKIRNKLKGNIPPNRKPIYYFGEIFPCCRLISEKYNLKASSIYSKIYNKDIIDVYYIKD